MVVTGQQNVGLADDNEQDALHKIEALLNAPADTKPGGVRLVGPGGDAVELPPTVARLLTYMIGQMAHGKGINISPAQTELTPQEAAALLHVPTRFFPTLLREGAIPFTGEGETQRVRLRDVLAYKKVRDAERHKAIIEIRQLGREIEEMYDE